MPAQCMRLFRTKLLLALSGLCMPSRSVAMQQRHGLAAAAAAAYLCGWVCT